MGRRVARAAKFLILVHWSTHYRIGQQSVIGVLVGHSVEREEAARLVFRKRDLARN